MNRNFYEEIKTAEFKPITYRLYNKIDDEFIPRILSKKYNEIYNIDDFEYCSLDLDKKEKFLLSMHNKQFLSNIEKFKKTVEEKDGIVNINYVEQEINVIKLNHIKFE